MFLPLHAPEKEYSLVVMLHQKEAVPRENDGSVAADTVKAFRLKETHCLGVDAPSLAGQSCDPQSQTLPPVLLQIKVANPVLWGHRARKSFQDGQAHPAVPGRLDSWRLSSGHTHSSSEVEL